MKRPANTEPACGKCRWWRRDAEDVQFGECYFNPPSVISDEDGTPTAVRPTLEESEPACSKFEGSQ